MEDKNFFARWRSSFLTGLVIVLPMVVSLAVLFWLFGTVANVTDTLLVFIPKTITHKNHGEGPMYWYWSVAALLLAILLISLIGRLARNYIGQKMIEWAEAVMLRIPLFNKIYGAIRQVNDAFSSGGKNSFKTVVLVEFPRAGAYSVGFITSEEQDEVRVRTRKKLVTVFIPTTPNPTSGFMILIPEDEVTKLDMSVAEGIKYIVSLGSISPEYEPPKKSSRR